MIIARPVSSQKSIRLVSYIDPSNTSSELQTMVDMDANESWIVGYKHDVRGFPFPASLGLSV